MGKKVLIHSHSQSCVIWAWLVLWALNTTEIVPVAPTVSSPTSRMSTNFLAKSSSYVMLCLWYHFQRSISICWLPSCTAWNHKLNQINKLIQGSGRSYSFTWVGDGPFLTPVQLQTSLPLPSFLQVSPGTTKLFSPNLILEGCQLDSA